MLEDIRVFGGSASKNLTESICRNLGEAPGKSKSWRFPDGNTFVKIRETVRNQNVYIVQSVANPTNDNFMELLFWIDAFKRASAASVTAVVPYFSYAKGDKKDEPRVSVRARVCADAIQAAGADRVVTMDLHAPQIQGFFRIPVDDLRALPMFSTVLENLRLKDPVVVSPDPGYAKTAREYAGRLGAPLAIADKQRPDNEGTIVIHEIIGHVEGRAAMIVDDFTVSGGTIFAVANKLVQQGATEVYAAVTHGVFSEDFAEKLENSPIKKLWVTDTVENQMIKDSNKISVVSVAPLFAEAIRRIHTRQSISVLFENGDAGSLTFLPKG